MDVRYHRIAAGTILVSGLVLVLAWGRSMAIEPAAVQSVRDQFQGEWVATRVQAAENLVLEGLSANVCRAEFTGKEVTFHQLIGGIDTRGTFYLDPSKKPGWVDFKLDAGWSVAIYEFNGETLKIACNPLTPSEQLGVPGRARPRQIGPAATHFIYEFRRAKPRG